MKNLIIGMALFQLALGCKALPTTRPASTQPSYPPPSQVIRLWNGDAPEAKGSADEDIPTLSVYRAPARIATGAAMIVCPGGGYGKLAPHEGGGLAKWLNSNGITMFVLKYRLGPKYHHPAEMLDVQRAIRLVRSRADEWKLDPKRIGVLGFSAGGHLASTAATKFDEGRSDASDPADRASSRPDLAVLAYPVITFTEPFSHKPSRRNLLGEPADPKLVELMSSEKHVSDKTPPCFLVATADDASVPVENSLMFFAACKAHKVPVEMHIFEHGKHGFGLGGKDPQLGTWPTIAANWLRQHGFAR